MRSGGNHAFSKPSSKSLCFPPVRTGNCGLMQWCSRRRMNNGTVVTCGLPSPKWGGRWGVIMRPMNEASMGTCTHNKIQYQSYTYSYRVCTDQHTTLPQTIEHPVRVRHALQRHPMPRIIAERRAIPVVVPLGASRPQRRRPKPVIHEPLLLVTHSLPVIPPCRNDSLDRPVPVNLVHVRLGWADMGVAK